jgi:hypothetical protein
MASRPVNTCALHVLLRAQVQGRLPAALLEAALLAPDRRSPAQSGALCKDPDSPSQ